MANNTTPGARAPISPQERFAAVDSADVANAVATEASLKSAETLLASSAQGADDRETKKLLGLAQHFVNATGFYRDALTGRQGFVRECTTSSDPNQRRLGFALSEATFKGTDETPERQELRIRAEFTIQSLHPLAKRCYDFREEARRAYEAAANPPAPVSEAREERRQPALTSAITGLLRFART